MTPTESREGGKQMTRKKPTNGKEKRKTPTRRTKSDTINKPEKASLAVSSKRTRVVEEVPLVSKHHIPISEELHTDIERRAYELYERRGWRHGEDLHDWLEAEREILIEQSVVKS